MSEPKQLQPQYLGSSKNAPAPRNPMVAFWNDQVMAPEHRSENLGILKAAAIFVVGVVFIRSDLSSALVPVF